MLFYTALVQIGFSQNREAPIVNDTLKTTKSDSAKTHKIELTGIFFSAGINATQYNSDAFFRYLYTTAGFAGLSFKYEKLSAGSTVPSKFSYSNPSLYPFFSLGLELSGIKHKKLHHIIELSYMHLSGTYSGTAYHTESYSNYPFEGGNSYNIWDTVQGKYSQTVLSIGYKFQPTFKFIFLSVGINCSVNLIQAERQKNEQTNGGWSNEMGYGFYPQTNTSSSASSSFYFINFPLQVGAGGVIHKNNIILEPAFYFTPCLSEGYNLYNMSLKILFNLKKE